MKFSNTCFSQLFIFSLISTVVRAEMPPTAIAQETSKIQVALDGAVLDVASQGEVIGSDLEATITLAELQEILIKIDEDLAERIDDLEYGDRQEIIKILKAKKESIITYLKELQGFDEETVALYLLMSRRKEDDTFLWFAGGVVAGATIGVLALASIDSKGVDWPNLDRLTSNFNHIVNGCKDFFSPTPVANPV